MALFNIGYLGCCGWRELQGLRHYNETLPGQDFDSVIKAIALTNLLYKGGLSCGALIFTEALAKRAAAKYHYAGLFAKEIENRGLGKVSKQVAFTNPNTGRQITTYLWYPDINALVDYATERKLFPVRTGVPV